MACLWEHCHRPHLDNHLGPPAFSLPPMRTSSLRSEHFYISALFTTHTNVLCKGRQLRQGTGCRTLRGGTNGPGLAGWIRVRELEQGRRKCSEARTQGQRRVLGPGSWGGSEARLVHGDLGLLEGAPVPHAAFQSEQDPVPFCLGPGEGLRGCRKVLIKLKVTQGKQLQT